MKSFVRRAAIGLLAGVLLFAALNALSYFVRTGGPLRYRGSIGFPWLAWEGFGNGFGHFYPDALIKNVAVGLLASLAAGCLFALLVRGERPLFWPQFPLPSHDDRTGPEAFLGRQFSMRGMLALVTAAAVLLAMGQEAHFRTKREILTIVYWLGPTCLASAFCLASWLAPRARDQIMLLVTALVLGAPLILGASSRLSDPTLLALGFFIHWTPQCVLLLAFFAVWGFAHSKA